MREYRGDNYKELIPEIMSIMNITNYLHNEFKNTVSYTHLDVYKRQLQKNIKH